MRVLTEFSAAIALLLGGATGTIGVPDTEEPLVAPAKAVDAVYFLSLSVYIDC
jgi:hypothetical protein